MIKTTVNGSLIPQDPAGNDMCLLFMKFGRCRFKNKCKRSHWLPPLPEGSPTVIPLSVPPYTTVEALSYDGGEITPGTPVTEDFTQQDLQENDILPTLTIDEKSTLVTPKKTRFLPRRFQYIFHDDELTRSSGFQKIVEQVNVYFDVAQQKVMPVNAPKNKAEKQHLKLVKRLHWKNTQKMKEKLNTLPPSYHLSFNKNKCLSSHYLPNKTVKPSAFDYLVADTLIAYMESRHITALEAELKLRQWGARPIRARQCVDHIWHIVAKSSNTVNGCAEEVVELEQKLLEGQRSTLDYAYACRHALKQTTIERATNNESQAASNICHSVKQGSEVRKKTNMTQRKRKRSKQFKKVTLVHRKNIKSRLLEILQELH